MLESKEKKKYASPVTEAIAILPENRILVTSNPEVIEGVVVTAYDEIILWS